MTTIFSEVLPPNRTSKHRAFTWEPCPVEDGCPCVGVLTVSTNRKNQRYAVAEVYPSPGYGSGRAFEVRKADGTVYHCFLADDRPRSTCDCPGHSYAASERADRRHGDRFETLGCAHLDALDALVGNGWLVESRTDAGPASAPAEAADRELPECFRGCSVVGCPF